MVSPTPPLPAQNGEAQTLPNPTQLPPPTQEQAPPKPKQLKFKQPPQKSYLPSYQAPEAYGKKKGQTYEHLRQQAIKEEMAKKERDRERAKLRQKRQKPAPSETSKPVQHKAEVHAGKVGGSYWSTGDGMPKDMPKDNINAHTRVVTPTLVSLIEPRTETDLVSPSLAAVAAAEPGDLWGLDPHKPGLVVAWAIESEDLKTRVEDANILPPTVQSSGLSPSRSPSALTAPHQGLP